MREQELVKMSDQQLLEVAISLGVQDAHSMSRKNMISALMTYPEQGDSIVLQYIDEAVPGNLVAFRNSNYRVKSAKIVKKSTADKKLLLETKYGKQHLVPYSDIVWVNTTGHWPRWVYDLLKGVNQEVECENTDGEEA